MAGHDIVVIGGSAGGVEAMRTLCAGLPKDLPAAVFVVLHISPASHSILPELLTRAGPLPARHPRSDEAITPGVIYVAPPDLHMLLRRDQVILRRGPHENRTRPAIDPLFRSAAVSYRSRVIGVVLSGLLNDGSAGLVAIKSCGGLCVVQDPDDAVWPEMPRNALACDHVDHCAPVADISSLLNKLVREPPSVPPAVPKTLEMEAKVAEQENPVTSPHLPLGRATRLSCPQCGGVLNEVTEEGSAPFRCQVGHAFSTETLVAAQNDELERALVSAMRIHRERLSLFRRMQQQSEAQSMSHAAARWRDAADEAEKAAELIAQALNGLRQMPE